MSRRTPSETQRPALTRRRIIDAAIDLADMEGLDGVTMRRVAHHLGYEVMSLYNHVANKDDLFDGMVDVIAGEIIEPESNTGWRETCRGIAMSAHEVLLRHRWGSALWSTRWPGRNRWRHMESLLEALAGAGLPADLADLGFHAITLHIQGFTQQQVSYAAAETLTGDFHERFDAAVDPKEFPLLTAHMGYHRETAGHLDEFAFVLDLILDGLARSAEP